MALFDANAEQPGAALARKRRTGSSRGLDGPLLIVVLLVPSLILLIGIIFYPVFNTVLLSFQSLNLADPLSNHWVGLENYTKILTNPVFDFWHCPYASNSSGAVLHWCPGSSPTWWLLTFSSTCSIHSMASSITF